MFNQVGIALDGLYTHNL